MKESIKFLDEIIKYGIPETMSTYEFNAKLTEIEKIVKKASKCWKCNPQSEINVDKYYG